MIKITKLKAQIELPYNSPEAETLKELQRKHDWSELGFAEAFGKPVSVCPLYHRMTDMPGAIRGILFDVYFEMDGDN